MNILKLNIKVRLAIAGVAAIVLIAALVFGIRAILPSHELSFKRIAQEIPTASIKAIEPFGDGFLIFDGTALRYYDDKGNYQWEYSLGVAGDIQFFAYDAQVVLWCDTSFALVKSDGSLNYSGQMAAPIESARCGSSLAALKLSGSDGVLILDLTGATVDNIELHQNALMDYGFYATGDLMWMLTLDVSGAVPVSMLQTYQPGKLLTGGYSFSDQIVYEALFHQEQITMEGTHYITTSSKTANEAQASPIAIYGWELATWAMQKGVPAMLFTLTSQENTTPTALRVVQGTDITNLYVPPGSLAVYAGSNAVYSIGTNAVYSLPYAGGKTTSYSLPSPIDGIAAKLSGNKVLVTSEAHVYMLSLP